MAARKTRNQPEPEPAPAPEPESQPELAPEPAAPGGKPEAEAAQPAPWGGWDRFDRFTERAKKSLVLAQEEAARLGHNYIGTEHILLGLVAESEGIAAKVLALSGVQLNKVRSNVEFIIGRGDRASTGTRSLTPRSKKVIELAIDEARLLNHNYIGTEHLLLGLIREGEGIAAGVLESLGVDMPKARETILGIIARAEGQLGEEARRALGGALPEASAPKDNVITCRIDSGDLEALDALIEAGIRSTRSDAAAWLIHAGIQANLDLFDKVYSTVAEIKRLRDQAQSAAKDLESSTKLQSMRRRLRGTPPSSPTTPTEPTPPT